MSDAEFIKVKYRLSEQVAKPGGMTAELAQLERAAAAKVRSNVQPAGEQDIAAHPAAGRAAPTV